VNLDGEKITTLFSVNVTEICFLNSILNVGNKVIYGLYTPKMFLSFNKTHHLKLLYSREGKPE